jgi:hypothetical protein
LGAGAFCKERDLSISDISIALYVAAWLEAIMTKDMDVETAAQIAASAFAKDLMISNLGQVP